VNMEQGIWQGNALGSFLLAVSIQPMLRRVQDAVPTVRVLAVMDDIHIVGPVKDTLEAYRLLKKECGDDCIQISSDKLQYFSGIHDAGDPVLLEDDYRAAMREFHEADFGAMVTLGAVVGDSDC